MVRIEYDIDGKPVRRATYERTLGNLWPGYPDHAYWGWSAQGITGHARIIGRHRKPLLRRFTRDKAPAAAADNAQPDETSSS